MLQVKKESLFDECCGSEVSVFDECSESEESLFDQCYGSGKRAS